VSEVARRAPYGHPVVSERGSVTRRRILEATVEVLAEVGFEATRVEVVAERAGCSRPTFYQYFSSKHDVFWALATALGEEIVALAGRLEPLGRGADGVERLADWIGEFMVLHGQWRPVFASFQAASRDHLPEARRSTTVSLRTDSALLRAFGVPDDGFEERLMGALFAVLDRSSFYMSQDVPDADTRPLEVALAELCHRSVLGPLDGVNLHRGRRAVRRQIALPRLKARPPDPLPPRQEATRGRLLDAGRKVLPTRGYHDSRVDDIVSAAGVSHGSFYRYFESKDHFFQVLAEGAALRAVDLVEQLDLTSSEDDLRRWVVLWMHAYRDDGGIISVWQEMHTNVGLGRFSRVVAASMFSVLVARLEHRDFGNPEADATSLLALLERLPNNVYTLGFTAEDDGIEILVTMLRRGYLGLDD
jgi:AcrR family transcriptional regulator